ncbi:hypothetical protein CR51_36525 [Caballeronia megalochromosomata]|nr:hypothetical protein CR51_36525 [Caballeronia megalochromosomata]
MMDIILLRIEVTPYDGRDEPLTPMERYASKLRPSLAQGVPKLAASQPAYTCIGYAFVGRQQVFDLQRYYFSARRQSLVGTRAR